MRVLNVTIAGLLATCFCGASLAAEADPVQMARSVGFVGCDSLIAETFDIALKSSDRRLSINYFNETAGHSIDLLATFGSVGDAVVQNAHFEQSGGFCYVTNRALVAEVGNCAGLLSKDAQFKYKNDSAGALWAENKGGVTKLLVQSGGTCNQIYAMDGKRKLAR